MMINSTAFEKFNEIKYQYPDAILLFRRGDFYESYDADANDVERICEFESEYNAPVGFVKTTGFPFHKLDSYLPKLVRAGRRVAICDDIVGDTEI